MKYNTYELMPAHATYYLHSIDEDVPLDFEELCVATLSEDMKPLDEISIKSHLYSMAMVGTFWSGHNVQHTDVVAYAGVTGFEEHNGMKLAEIGGVITLPGERNAGHSTSTIGKVLEDASLDESLAEHGHEGFLAKCNPNSIGLFVTKFGFEIAGHDATRYIAIKHLEPKY
jgi:hypothetical protein